MDNQAKFRTQQANPFFEDGRAMRLPVPGTVARGELHGDEAYQTGRLAGAWISEFPSPVDVTLPLVQRGRHRFDIYCLPCHGPAGHGDGVIDVRAKRLLINTRRGYGTSWVPPANLHLPAISQQPVGQIYHTIANGLNTMPAYGPQIPVRDRWAITAYVKSLQWCQNASSTESLSDGPTLIPKSPPAATQVDDE
jgi:mono/diheme cytochrome c family protein